MPQILRQRRETVQHSVAEHTETYRGLATDDADEKCPYESEWFVTRPPATYTSNVLATVMRSSIVGWVWKNQKTGADGRSSARF
jgi:hypothetical protein